MSVSVIWLAYAGVGAFAGLLAGAFGIGGGIVIIPSLLFVFGLQAISSDVAMHLAIGTSLASIAITGSSSAWSHYRNGTVLVYRVRQLLPGLMVGAVLGVFVAGALSGHMLSAAFGLFLVLLALNNLFSRRHSKRAFTPTTGRALVAGGVIGGISALFGIGGGTLSVPWLTRCGTQLKEAIGTSAACGVPIAVFGTATFIGVGWGHPSLPAGATGFVMWPALLGMALTSVPFARMGAHLTRIAPNQLLNQLFSAILLIVGTKFLIGYFS